MALKIGFVKASIGGTPCFIPATPLDSEEFAKIKTGPIYTAEYKKTRNWVFHRKFFSMLNFVFDNMDDGIKERRNVNTVAGMLIDLKILIGHYDLWVTAEGTPLYMPKSIDFASMDQFEFEEFYKQCYEAIYSHYLPIDQRSLEQAVVRLMGYEVHQ